MSRRALTLSIVAIIVVVIGACGVDYPTCYGGEYRSCTCDDGATGYQRCFPTQDGYGACVCGSPATPGLDAAADVGDE
jgi:hypothetical protein